jgi:hypothetical protein
MNPILSLPHEFIYCFSKGVKPDGNIMKDYEGITSKWSKSRAESEMEQDKYNGTNVIGVMRHIPLKNGIAVIDIDENKPYMDVIQQFPCLKHTLYVKGNTKGWHFYVHYDWPKNSVDVLDGIQGDVCGEKIFEREDKEWSTDPIKTLTPQEFSMLVKPADIMCHTYHSKKQLEDAVLPAIRKINEEEAEFRDYLKFGLLPATDYQDWRNVGFGLFHTFGGVDVGLELFHLYSKVDMEKYDFARTTKFYASIKPTEGKKITFNTIRAMAKNTNHEVFKSILKLHTPERELAANDNEAADIVLRMLDGKLLYCNQHYYKYGNIWISDTEKIKSALQTYIMGSRIFKPPTSGMNDVLFWANFSAAEKLVKCVLQRISLQTTDYDKFHTTTKHRFCFLDGVLDFKARRFYTWNQIDFEYYPVVQIPMRFNDFEPCRSTMDEIVEKVLRPLFGDNLPLAMNYLSRSLAGCTEDKNFATYLGNRNCGKGVLFNLLKGFGDYVGAFPVKNILCERNGKGAETARDLYWLMEFEFMRLAVSQEIPPEFSGMKLKTEVVKKICSGGDTQTARRNYDKRDTHFQVETSLFLMGNDPIQMDGDVLEHHLFFESAIQFKTQAFIEQVREQQGELATRKYRVADTTIKEKCSSQAWQLAFIQLMYESFKDSPITVETENVISNPVMNSFYEDWTITGDKEHVVLGAELEYLGKKLKSELKLIGIDYKKFKKGEFRDKWVYIGIQRKEKEDSVGSQF